MRGRHASRFSFVDQLSYPAPPGLFGGIFDENVAIAEILKASLIVIGVCLIEVGRHIPGQWLLIAEVVAPNPHPTSRTVPGYSGWRSSKRFTKAVEASACVSVGELQYPTL